MKLLLIENDTEIKIKYLSYVDKNIDILPYQSIHDPKTIDAVMLRSAKNIDADFLKKYSNLRHIFRVGVGLEKIDLDLCERKNIQVHNTPDANADSVADLVVGAIIFSQRQLYKNFSKNYSRFDFMGSQISEKKIGIVGFGNIGKKVYNRLMGFGVTKFLIFDPFVSEAQIGDYKYCQKIDTKEQVFSCSDILTFHIPLTTETKNFLSGEDISLLKKNVTIINTARGGIINEAYLIKFLEKNPESYFFADVWNSEPQIPKKLLSLKNVTITPHIGAMTHTAEKQMHYFPFLEAKK